MNSLKKIFLRLFKQIEVYNPRNISYGQGVTLSNGSILNARKGRIMLGDKVRIGNSSELVPGKEKSIIIKDYSTLYSNCKLLGDILVERYCLFAPNVYASSGTHSAFEQPEKIIKRQDHENQIGGVDLNKPIHIHEDVWIGEGVYISPGTKIGRGAVIGAGSVVTRDVYPYDVVAGVPAKHIKKRLDFIPPASLSSDSKSDWPYFYQGFNHFEIGNNNHGVEIIDNAVVFLKISSSSLFISGFAESDNKLIITINDQIWSFVIDKVFQVSIDNVQFYSNEQEIEISVNQQSKVYISGINSTI